MEAISGQLFELSTTVNTLFQQVAILSKREGECVCVRERERYRERGER